MQKTYSTAQAARRMGVSFRTLNRWLALGKISPSHPTTPPMAVVGFSGAGQMPTSPRVAK